MRWPVPRWVWSLVEQNRANWRWVVLTSLVAAIALAGYDLVRGWEVPSSPLADVVAIGLVLIAVAACVALLVFSGDERGLLPAGADSLKVVGVAARGVSWSSLFAIGISVLLFANCSAGVTSGDLTTGATANPSQFWPMAVLLLLPLALTIALPAALAMLAKRFANRGRLHEARKVAHLGLWSTGLIAVAALATTGVAFFGGVSQCFLVSTASRCAAGVGGLMNLTAIASLLVIVPYMTLMRRALLGAVPRPGGMTL